MNNNIFNGSISVNGNQGPISFGGNSTTTNIYQIEQGANQIAETIRGSSFSDAQRAELEQILQTIVKEVKLDNPNKDTVGTNLSKIKGMLEAGGAAATVIDFVDKWSLPIKIGLGLCGVPTT